MNKVRDAAEKIGKILCAVEDRRHLYLQELAVYEWKRILGTLIEYELVETLVTRFTEDEVRHYALTRQGKEAVKVWCRFMALCGEVIDRLEGL